MNRTKWFIIGKTYLFYTEEAKPVLKFSINSVTITFANPFTEVGHIRFNEYYQLLKGSDIMDFDM